MNAGLKLTRVGLLVLALASVSNAADPARDPKRVVRISVLQAGEKIGEGKNPGFDANFEMFARLAREAAADKPNLIVFPEYAISGWPYPDGEKINELAESIPGDGPWFRKHVDLAKELKTPLLGWLVGRKDGKLVSTSMMFDGSGKLVGTYEKVQCNLGEQTWWGWSQGDKFRLIELDGVRYGVSICSDMWFPETARCYELMGADVLLHQSIGDDMGHLVPARAFDSYMPIVCSINRGGGYAVDARGELLGKLPPEKPAWKTFDIRPFEQQSDRKYGGRWIPELGHRNLRNVGAYSILVDPRTRPRWTEVFQDDQKRPQTEDQLRKRFDGRWDAHDPGATVPTSTTNLSVIGSEFAVNGQREFLTGISYYSATGASDDTIARDLDEIQRLGFRWIRVWATWDLFKNDVSAFDPEGNVREPYFSRLQSLVRECDRRGLVVDLTFERGRGRVSPGVRDLAAHSRALETLVRTLRSERNWYLDLANECDVRDYRYVNVHELKTLRDLVKEIDPGRLVTASYTDGFDRVSLLDLLKTVQVDMVCLHGPRDAGSAEQTEGRSRKYVNIMREIGRVVPLHYQEPFRRGYQNWEPTSADMALDIRGAKAGGAAGWCYHNGDQRSRPDGRPARSFDLSDRRLFEQLDPVDREQIAALLLEDSKP